MERDFHDHILRIDHTESDVELRHRPPPQFRVGRSLETTLRVEELVCLFVTRLNADICHSEVNGFVGLVHNGHSEFQIEL